MVFQFCFNEHFLHKLFVLIVNNAVNVYLRRMKPGNIHAVDIILKQRLRHFKFADAKKSQRCAANKPQRR
jgi:hypothetical protein